MPDSDTMPSEDTLSEAERKLLSRMNKVGIRADITIQKAAGILQRSENATRTLLNGLVNKGYLDADISKVPFVYRLQQHFPE